MFTQAALLGEANDPTTAKDRLHAIPAEVNANVDVLNAIIDNANADNETFRLVANDGKADHTTWLKIAQDARSDAETLHVLAAKNQGPNGRINPMLTAVLAHRNLAARTLALVYGNTKASLDVKRGAFDVFRAMCRAPATLASELNDLATLAARVGVGTAAGVALKEELLTLVASHGNASEEALDRIIASSGNNANILVAVAANLNASGVQLRALANIPVTPTVVLQAIIDRGIQNLPADVLSAILKHANSVPGGGVLGGGNTIRQQVAAEFTRRARVATTTTEDLVVIAADLADPADMQAILAMDPSRVTKDVLMGLARNNNADQAVLRVIASSENVDEDVLKALPQHNNHDADVDRAIIANDKATEAVLTGIAQRTNSEQVLDDLVKSAKVTSDILAEIVGNNDASDAVLVQAVNHGKLTQQMLHDVAIHKNADVQALGAAVGHNSVDEAVLIGIAGNPNVTADILGRVARSDEATDAVLTAVADCAKADDALWALVVASAKATTAVIANVAGKAINVRTAMAISQSDKANEASLQAVSLNVHATQPMLLALAQNSAATKQVLIDVCGHAAVDDAVLAAVAVHANLDDAAAAYIFVSPQVSDATIAAYFDDAARPMSADDLEWLAEYATAPRLLTFVTTCTNKTEVVLNAIVANRNSTDEVLAAVAHASDGSGNILTDIRRHRNFAVHAEAALIAHPNTDVASLRAKAQNGATLDVGLAAAAAHKNATKDVLDDVMGNVNRGEAALIAVVNSTSVDEQLVRNVIADAAVVTDNVLAAISDKIDLDAIATATVFTQQVLSDLIAAPRIGPATIATMDDFHQISEAQLLVFIPTIQSPALLTFIAQQRSDNVTEGVLDAIANNPHSDGAVLADVVRHENATLAVLTTVVGAGAAYGVEAMEAVAGNREASEAMLDAIARNRAITAAQAGTLAIIARRDGVSEGLLDSISRRNRPATAEVLGVVAAKTTVVATLNRVANHANRDAAVLQAVVANEHADEAALNVAAQHLAVDDMAAVVGHDHATDLVYQQVIAIHGAGLSAGVLETIAEKAQDVQTLRNIEALNPGASVLTAVALNDQADAALLNNIVVRGLHETYRAVASHDNTDIADLQTIVALAEATEEVLAAIAGHRNADVPLVLLTLQHDNTGMLVSDAAKARTDGVETDNDVVRAIEAVEEQAAPILSASRIVVGTGADGAGEFQQRLRDVTRQAESTSTDYLDVFAASSGTAVSQTNEFAQMYASYRRQAAQDRQGVLQRAEQRKVTPEDLKAIASADSQQKKLALTKLGMK